MRTLIDILSHRRPDRSATLQACAQAHVVPLGARPDAEGNYILDVGPTPTILWSAHMDTVHREGGMQRVGETPDGRIIALPSRKGRIPTCLGADDGVGIWLLINMVNAGVPGRYVWHVGEECGSRGSKYLRHSGMLDGIQIAMAFDRRNTSSVITHQWGGRCASDAFGQSFAEALTMAGLPGYRLDAGGVFTDTANYTDHVGECSNLSVGYDDEHRSGESLLLSHAFALRDALCQIDTSNLQVVRQPGEIDPHDFDSLSGYLDRESWGTSDRRTYAYADDVPTNPGQCWMEETLTGIHHALRQDWTRTGRALCGESLDENFATLWSPDDSFDSEPEEFCSACVGADYFIGAMNRSDDDA